MKKTYGNCWWEKLSGAEKCIKNSFLLLDTFSKRVKLLYFAINISNNEQLAF